MAGKKKIGEFSFEVDLEDCGGIQKFQGFESVKEWIDEERVFWSWIVKTQSPLNTLLGRFDDYYSRIEGTISGTESTLERFEEIFRNEKRRCGDDQNQIKALEADFLRKEEAQISSFKTDISTILREEILIDKRHLFRGIPSAVFCEELGKKDPRIGSFGICYFLGNNFNTDTDTAFEGAMQACLFKYGYVERLPMEVTAYKTAIATHNKELDFFKDKYNAQEEIFENQIEKTKSLIKSFDSSISNNRTIFEEQINKQKLEFKNLKSTYDQHMKLEAPVKYWCDKKESHKNNYERLLKSLRGWGLFGLLLMLANVFIVLPESTEANKIPWRNLSFCIIFSSLIIWGIRILVKLYLSQLHLFNDAEEREVLAKTYLAMHRGEGGTSYINKEDIGLVLAPLFRPSSTGVIKDDTGPTLLTDMISRIGGKPKSK